MIAVLHLSVQRVRPGPPPTSSVTSFCTPMYASRRPLPGSVTGVRRSSFQKGVPPLV